ncbi:MAG: ABC transporter permease [Coriobacteriia bacterium]|nr:ABC transporter permease [Coriobacteriia bacterium]
MRGSTAFLRKEMIEIARTWRIWVLPGIVVFFALSGPVLAKLTPQLLESVGAGQEGVVIRIPTPTYTDGFLQWTQNLAQLVTFAIVIIFGGVVSAERRSGTAVLVLTKPLTRAAFVLAKFAGNAVLLVCAVTIGALLTWGVTYAVFGEAPYRPLAEATGVWLVWGLMLLGIMTLLSVAVDSQAGAAGAGLGVFLVLSVLSLWGPALRYTPAGLVGAPTDVVMSRPGDLLFPLVTGAATGALALAAAVRLFERKEL